MHKREARIGLTSTLIDNQLGMYDYPAVVGPFSPCQEEDDDQGHDGNNTTGCGPNPSIFNRLGEGIKPCEPRLRRHFVLYTPSHSPRRLG